MREEHTMKNITAFVIICMVAQSFAASPSLSGVSWYQRSPNDVQISYTLSGSPAIVTLDVYTNGVRVSTSAISSLKDALVPAEAGTPVNCLVDEGDHTLLWKARADLPDLKFLSGEVSMTLKAWSPTEPPDYMLVDMSNPTNVHYYASLASLPWPFVAGGDAIPEDDPYRTTHLLMRRIPAAGVKWRMGAGDLTSSLVASAYAGHETPHYVTLTNDYYMAVFETTQGQYATWMDAWPSAFSNKDSYPDRALRPVEKVSLQTLRGVESGICASGSAIGKLRSHSRGIAFDLPTEAQWEFACRAGTDSFFSNGANDSSSLGTIAWFSSNAGSTTHPVGMKAANAFGLYDMHGNVFEKTLDYNKSPVDSKPVIDPRGPVTGSTYVTKGGSFNYGNTACTSSAGRTHGYSNVESSIGFRLMAPIPAERP